MDQNQESVITTIAALFAVVAIAFGLSYGGAQLVDTFSETAQQTKSNLSDQKITQTVSAQSGCPTYAKEIDEKCRRSGSTTYTVVLGTSTDPTTDPNPVCEITPDNPTVGDDVTFSASSSSDPDGSITGYEWTISAPNGGGTINQEEFTVNNAYAGDYEADLEVTDNDGNTATTSCSVTVTSGTNTPPTASCTTSPNNPDEDDTIYFYGNSSDDPDGTIDSYSWQITDPDGNTSNYSGDTQSFSNPDVGTYNATLTVEDNDGATDTESCSIEVDSATVCNPGDPDGPDATPTSSPWVELEGSPDKPNEDTNVTYQIVDSNLIVPGSCSPSGTESVGDDGPLMLGTTCQVDASSTPPSTVSDSYRVCVQNVAPTADDHSFEMTVDETLNESVNASDPIDPLNYLVIDQPDNGTVSMSGSDFTYEPDTNYFGSDSFTYQVDDGDGGIDTGTVSIDIYNNDPKADFSGPSELDYCQNNSMVYDGSSSDDKQVNNPTSRQDGDSGSIASYNWNTAPTRSTTISGGGSILELDGPVNWEDPTDIELTVEDDEGVLSSLVDQEVTVNVPEYKANIVAPIDPQQIWITASSTKRSTKSTIKVTDIDLPSEDFDTDYSFSDLQVDVSAAGIDDAVWESSADSSSNEFQIWANPQNQSEEIQFGTYDVTVEIELPLAGGCVWDKETVTIPLRAQTTAEF